MGEFSWAYVEGAGSTASGPTGSLQFRAGDDRGQPTLTGSSRLIFNTASQDHALTLTGSFNISGNLNVAGNITTISASNLSIQDSIIGLGFGTGSNHTGVAGDRGFVFGITGNENKALFWDQTSGSFVVGKVVSQAPHALSLDVSEANLSTFKAGGVMVSGATGVRVDRGPLSASGRGYFTDVVQMAGTLNVSGSARFLSQITASSLNAHGDIKATGSFSGSGAIFTDDVQIADSLHVSGATLIGHGLAPVAGSSHQVTGAIYVTSSQASHFSGSLDVVGGITATSGFSGSTAIFTDDVQMADDLAVSGNITLGRYIYHDGDDNTKIEFTDDEIVLTAGGREFIKMTEASNDIIEFNRLQGNNFKFIVNASSMEVFTVDNNGVIINDEGMPQGDFRVESNNKQRAFYLDADNEFINILVDADHVQGATTGSDTSLFVSGTIGSKGTSVRGTSVFGGDVVISGTLHGGSPLNIGSDLLIEDDKKVIFGTDSDSSIEYDEDGTNRLIISGSAAGINITGSAFFAGEATFEDDVTCNDSLTLAAGDGALNFSVAGQNSIKIPDGQAVALTIEEADNAYLTFVTSNGSEKAIFDVDVKIKDDKELIFGNNDDASIEYDESGTDTLIISGAEGGIKITAPLVINEDGTDSDFRVESDTKQRAFYINGDTQYVNILVDADHVQGATTGSDTALFVSGTINSKATSVRGTSVFGGDVVVSGAFYLEEIGAPGTIADGTVALYGKDDSGVTKLYFKNESGETEVGTGGGGAVETYTNNGNNRIITSVNSTTINGEANATFDGSELRIIGRMSGTSLDIHGDIEATGSFSGSGAIFTNNVQMASTLNVSGSARFLSQITASSLNAHGDIKTTGSFSGSAAIFTDDVQMADDLAVSGSSEFVGFVSASNEIFGYSIRTSGDIASSGSIILNDGGSLKEGGGTAAFTFDGSGHVTKIGQDSPSEDQVLAWDGSKAVWVDAGGGGGAVSTYTNNGNNRLITSVDANTINGEANATFDGSELRIVGRMSGTSLNIHGNIQATGSFSGSGAIFTDDVQMADDLAISGTVSGTFFQLSSPSAHKAQILADDSILLNCNNVVLGAGGDAEITLDFNANSNDGRLTWYEDEAQFHTSNGLLIGPANPTQIGFAGPFGTGITLDSSSAKYTTPFGANYAVGSCEVITIGGNAVTQGNTLYLHTDGAWDNVKADDDDTGGNQLLGIALGSNTTTHGVLIKGLIRMPSAKVVGTFEIGQPVYIESGTAGILTFTQPSQSGDIVRQVGYCVDKNSSTDILLYFNPSDTYIEIA